MNQIFSTDTRSATNGHSMGRVDPRWNDALLVPSSPAATADLVVDGCYIIKDNGPAKDTGTNIQQFSSAVGHSWDHEWEQWSSD